MFERFTSRARQTVMFAKEEARRLGHDHIDTEHILLGLVRDGGGIAAESLRQIGVAPDDVRVDVLEIVEQGSQRSGAHLPFTDGAKQVLELAGREATQLAHTYVDSDHILVALVREGDGVAARVLTARGADLVRVRSTVLEGIRSRGADPRRHAARQTAGTTNVMANARRLAASAPLGSHHLLEALARSEDSLASKVLASFGVDAEALAAKIDEIGIEGTSDIRVEAAAP